MEKSNFRVILEVMVDNNILKEMMDETSTIEKSQKHLEIISNQILSLSQMKEIYLKCHVL